MTALRPDFSPSMLRAFLHARAGLRLTQAEGLRNEALKAFKRETRKQARVTVQEFDMAWMGQLQSPLPRTRLWGALGHVPSDSGMLLTHAGQEVFSAPPLNSLVAGGDPDG